MSNEGQEIVKILEAIRAAEGYPTNGYTVIMAETGNAVQHSPDKDVTFDGKGSTDPVLCTGEHIEIQHTGGSVTATSSRNIHAGKIDSGELFLVAPEKILAYHIGHGEDKHVSVDAKTSGNAKLENIGAGAKIDLTADGRVEIDGASNGANISIAMREGVLALRDLEAGSVVNVKGAGSISNLGGNSSEAQITVNGEEYTFESHSRAATVLAQRKEAAEQSGGIGL